MIVNRSGESEQKTNHDLVRAIMSQIAVLERVSPGVKDKLLETLLKNKMKKMGM